MLKPCHTLVCHTVCISRRFSFPVFRGNLSNKFKNRRTGFLGISGKKQVCPRLLFLKIFPLLFVLSYPNVSFALNAQDMGRRLFSIDRSWPLVFYGEYHIPVGTSFRLKGILVHILVPEEPTTHYLLSPQYIKCKSLDSDCRGCPCYR